MEVFGYSFESESAATEARDHLDQLHGFLEYEGEHACGVETAQDPETGNPVWFILYDKVLTSDLGAPSTFSVEREGP